MTRRTLVPGLAVAAVAGLVWLATLAPLAWLPRAVAGLGPLAPLAFVLLAAAALAMLVPRTPVSVVCGLLFGAAIGAACALAVALIAAAVTFAIGRRLGREVLSRRAGRHWPRVQRWIDKEGTLAVAAVRALPIGPYGLVGYAYGASTVRARHYALGTLIAATPSALTNAVLGAAIAGAPPRGLLGLVPLAFGLSLSTVVIVRARRRASARQDSGRQDSGRQDSGEQRVDQLTGAGQEG